MRSISNRKTFILLSVIVLVLAAISTLFFLPRYNRESTAKSDLKNIPILANNQDYINKTLSNFDIDSPPRNVSLRLVYDIQDNILQVDAKDSSEVLASTGIQQNGEALNVNLQIADVFLDGSGAEYAINLYFLMSLKKFEASQKLYGSFDTKKAFEEVVAEVAAMDPNDYPIKIE